MKSNIAHKEYYLFGASRVDFIAKGLYAGLKSRDGLPTPLPLRLQSDDEYVNAGYLDALPCGLVRDLGLNNVHLNIRCEGQIKVSIYILLSSGKVFHCSDSILDAADIDTRISVPAAALQDPNGCLIYFRIQSIAGEAKLIDWYFTTPKQAWFDQIKGLLLVSRSLGDSPQLIKRHKKLLADYHQIQNSYPDLGFFPIPKLVIYESDPESLQVAQGLASDTEHEPVKIVENPYNLGGGGNMCFAVYEEVVRAKNIYNFAMLDSDTVLPFRTFYLASILSSHMAASSCSGVSIPIVLYASSPNQILECGALFGRGNWGIVSSSPTQPCIQPLYHRELLSDPRVQAAVAGKSYTDYPPFIFSIFSAKRHQMATHFLPTPFFLRGDDIEMGSHLRSSGISCEVHGSLVVFQEPKHSLWHELMAILHGTCLVLANAALHGRVSDNFLELVQYFQARAVSHARIHDLIGLATYERVLDRLIDLMSWPYEEIVDRFHNPEYYLGQRDLNRHFSVANMRMLESLAKQSPLPSDEYVQLPFLYFESVYFTLVESGSKLPRRIGLVNASQQTAAILEPSLVDAADAELVSARIIEKAKKLFVNQSEELANRCLALTDREQIVNRYLARYSLTV